MPESLGSAVLELFTDNSAFDKGLGTAKKGAEGLGASFAKTGAALTASVTAPIVGFGLALGDAATDFQEMNQSIAVGTGATGAALDGLQDSARNVFASLPESAETVGNVLANLNTGLGITGGSLEALSIQTANASRLLGEEAAPNAQAFTQALNQFGVPATEAGKNLDFLFATSQSFGTSLGSLLTSTKDYGAVLKNAGFSMAESADLFGRLDKAGISVSRVMPGLNAAFRKMAEAGEEPQAALQGIVEAIKNAETPMDALAIATEKFGAEGAQRLSVAIREGAFELAGLGAGLESVGGLINDTAASNQTFEESMGKLKNQVTTLLEPLGTQLVTSLQDVVAEITPFVTQAAEAVKVFVEANPKVTEFGFVIAGLAAVVGPIVLLIGGLTVAVGAISAPILLGVAAFVAIGAALFTFREEIGTAITDFGVWIGILDETEEATRDLEEANKDAAKEADEHRKKVDAIQKAANKHAKELQAVDKETKKLTTSTKQLTDKEKDLKEQLDKLVRQDIFVEHLIGLDAHLADLETQLEDGTTPALADLGLNAPTVAGQVDQATASVLGLTNKVGEAGKVPLDAYTEALSALGIKSRDEVRLEIDELATAVGTVNAAVIAGKAPIVDLQAAQKAYKDALSAADGPTETTGKFAGSLGQVSTIITDLGKDTTMALFSGNFVGAVDAMKQAVVRFVAEDVMGALFTGLTDLIGLKDGLSGLGGVLGGLFGGSGGGAGQVAGGAAGAAGQIGGAAGAAGGLASAGLAGPIGAAGAVVSAISGVISNFQFAAMNKSLDLIEKSTRFTMLFVGGRGDQGVLGVLFNHSDWWQESIGNLEIIKLSNQAQETTAFNNFQKLESINNRMLDVVGAINNMHRDVVSALRSVAPDVTVNVTGDASGAPARSRIAEEVRRALRLNTGGLRTAFQRI